MRDLNKMIRICSKNIVWFRVFKTLVSQSTKSMLSPVFDVQMHPRSDKSLFDVYNDGTFEHYILLDSPTLRSHIHRTSLWYPGVHRSPFLLVDVSLQLLEWSHLPWKLIFLHGDSEKQIYSKKKIMILLMLFSLFFWTSVIFFEVERTM